MTTLELTPEEIGLLQETLEHDLKDLEVEVGHTDSREFKQMLIRRKAVMDRLLGKLKESVIPA